MTKASKYKNDWRQRRLEKGRCACCGNEPLLSTLYGLRCLKRFRRKARRKHNLTTWATRQKTKNRGGAIPLEKRVLVKCPRCQGTGKVMGHKWSVDMEGSGLRLEHREVEAQRD